MIDRRTFFRTVAGLKPSGAESQSIPGFTDPPSLEPYTGPWNRTTIMHLLRRTMIAPTYVDLQVAEGMTMVDLINALTAPRTDIPAPPRFVGECMNASAIAWDAGRPDIGDTFFDELRRWWLQLMIKEGFSVRERMTLFWHNHFSTNARLIPDARFLYLQNQLFRRLAIGDMKELVRQITIDKAMLHFLDGRYNKGGTINENYARELQELFTIGIADNDGVPNYSQKEVVEGARALTGWDWLGFGMQGDVSSSFLSGHDSSGKTMYGEQIAGAADGAVELDRLLDILFEQEQTARYVIRKLYRYFVYTDSTLTPVRPIPPEIEEHIITPLAAEFRASKWNIAALLTRLFSSRHFYDTAVQGATIKSPVDLMVSAIRGTLVGGLVGDAAEFGTQYAQGKMIILQQNLFHPPGVQGWQFYRSWISSTTLPQRQFYTDELIYGAKSRIIDRLNLVFNGPINRDGSWKIDALRFAKQFPSFNDPGVLVRDMAEHLLAFPASAKLLTKLKTELVGDRDYEWPDLQDEVRSVRLQAVLRAIMRSTNFQLM